MQLDDLVRLYQSKTDEELIQLAAEADQLTPEAHSQLRAELFRRRISIPSKESTSEARIDRGEIPSATSKVWLAQETNQFIADVLRLYHRHFWIFIKVVAPAVVVGYFAILFGLREGREIAHQLHRGQMYRYVPELFEIMLARLGGFFTSWMAFSVAYAGICSTVRQLDTGDSVSFSDMVGDLCKEPGRFLRLSILLFLVCGFAVAGSALLLSAILWMSPVRHLHIGSTVLWIIYLAVPWAALVVVSRFALSVPAVLLDGYKIGQSMFRSDALTEGKWLILAALVCKSYIGGYIAASAPFWLASQIPNTVTLPSWFSWALTAGSMAAVIVVEPPMFIGFALLYLRQSAVSPTKADAQLARPRRT